MWRVLIPMCDHTFLVTQKIRDYIMAVDTRLLSANLDTVESRFLEPPGVTQIGSRNWKRGIKLHWIGQVLFDYEKRFLYCYSERQSC